jgi:hypothetical protein
MLSSWFILQHFFAFPFRVDTPDFLLLWKITIVISCFMLRKTFVSHNNLMRL